LLLRILLPDGGSVISSAFSLAMGGLLFNWRQAACSPPKNSGSLLENFPAFYGAL
jgi:hypothetical protein